MTLTDSGPLAAIYVPDDPSHERCVAVLRSCSAPIVTSMPCFTEAMYFVGKARRWKGQDDLWRLVADGRLEVRSHTREDLERMRALMKRHADTPMDLTDASLVALAEKLGETLVFTLDAHFRAYRLRDRRAFRVTPGG